MTQMIHRDATLDEMAQRWRKALADAAVGPLIIAREVVELSMRWPDFEAEAKGVACTTWLRRHVARGKALPYWKERARAVDYLGEVSRRSVHHEVAVYVLRAGLTPAQRDEVKLMLLRGARSQNGHPLTKAQAIPQIYKIIGRTPEKRPVCSRCEKLEALLVKKGIDLPK